MVIEAIKDMLGIRKAQLEGDVALSQEAKRVIESHLVKKFFDEMESSSLAMWKSSQFEDVDGRERLYVFMRLTGRFKAFFEKCIADGQLAEEELQNIISGKGGSL